MLHHERVQPPDYVYPAHEWKIIEKRFYPRLLAQSETIFSTGNGYIGMRGNFEEGAPVSQNGTFVNGFHETWPICYAEEAYGFAKTGQTIVNVPDGRIIKLYVDDEPLFLPTANLLAFERVLDMQNGTLDRELVWEMPSGKQISVKSRRLVSFKHRHLAAINYQVTVFNATAPVIISSHLETISEKREGEGDDPRLARTFEESVLSTHLSYAQDLRVVQGFITKASKMSLACGVDHVVTTEGSFTHQSSCSDEQGKVVFTSTIQPGQTIELTKYITYHTSRRVPPGELCDRAERTLDRALEQGFSVLLEEQRHYLDDFWKKSDITLRAAPTALKTTEEFQQSVRFNLFQILQTAGRAEGAGIPAKGLTGQAYEGQYFWDIEIYVLPFLIYTEPRIAKNLLKFRYSMLDKARQRAREVNQKGALFPWRTINGEEASAYYAAGTAQYHINADIMYALKKYVNATGDEDFLYREGAEMLVETARLWRDLGFFAREKDGKFRIHAVTGPDEYTTVVNNNAYTNLMARENLRYAAETIGILKDTIPERFRELVDKTGLDFSEVEEWKRAAEQMYIPYDKEEGIHPQDDDFLELEVWDFDNTPLDKYPLLLSYHPLVIYRHQVIKQADIVLAMFLLGQEFSLEQKKQNFDYYDPLTTGDSSLSVGIQSIIASEIGYEETAIEYARYSVLMDLADVGGNVKDGCHIASMGGTWMVLVYGFAGMRDYDGKLSFNPKLPQRLEGLRFSLTFRGQVIEIDITQETVIYTLQQGEGLVIHHREKEIQLKPGVSVKELN